MMGKRWTRKEDEYIRSNYEHGDLNEMIKKLRRTKGSIIMHATQMGLARQMHYQWTKDDIDTMKRIYSDTSNRDIAKILGVPASKIVRKANSIGLHKSEAYIKSHPPTTVFKKGYIPANRKPVGYERVKADGYIEVKVADPNVFMMKQRAIWEQAYGPIPPKHQVIFKDGNKRNFDLSNLELIEKKTFILRTGMKKYTPEMRKLFYTQAVLTRLIKKKTI